MSLLSEEEIEGLMRGRSTLDFGKALQAAILAKLASAELPEPVVQRTKESKEKTLDDWFYASNPAYAKVHSSWKWEGLFTADQLRQAHAQGFAAGAAAQLAGKPSGYLSQHNLEMLRQGYPQTIVMLEGAKRDTPLYTRRQAK